MDFAIIKSRIKDWLAKVRKCFLWSMQLTTINCNPLGIDFNSTRLRMNQSNIYPCPYYNGKILISLVDRFCPLRNSGS